MNYHLGSDPLKAVTEAVDKALLSARSKIDTIVALLTGNNLPVSPTPLDKFYRINGDFTIARTREKVTTSKPSFYSMLDSSYQKLNPQPPILAEMVYNASGLLTTVNGHSEADINRYIGQLIKYNGTETQMIEAQKILRRPKSVTVPNYPNYPSASEYFYTLSRMESPEEFLNLLRIYDMYRLPSHCLYRTNVAKQEVYRGNQFRKTKIGDASYITISPEETGTFREMDPAIYDLFYEILYAQALEARQHAAMIAYGIRDLPTVKSYFLRLLNFIESFERKINEKSYIKVFLTIGNPKEYEFGFTTKEIEKLREVIAKVKKYIDIQIFELAAKAATLSIAEAPYIPSPTEKIPYMNVMLVPDVQRSEAEGKMVYTDISTAPKAQVMQEIAKPVIYDDIPLVAFKLAPRAAEAMSMERINLTSEGTRLQTSTIEEKKSILPWVLGAVALIISAKAMQ